MPQTARQYCLILLAAFFVAFASTACSAASRDVFRDMAANCLDITAVDYCGQCRTPLATGGCQTAGDCAATLEIWSSSENYVALRDRKMCGCPDNFVHGVAIPRAHVTGVEDPRRPEGIWEFAWNEGVRRIGTTSQVAIVVNPAGGRSQDHLHLHIARLKTDARSRFAPSLMTRVSGLDHVWHVAQKLARDANLSDYGVLLATHPEGGFLVLIDGKSPEKLFTEYACR